MVLILCLLSLILKNGNFGSLINVGDHNQLAKQIEFFYYNQNSKIIKKKIKLGFNHLNRFDLSLNCIILLISPK